MNNKMIKGSVAGATGIVLLMGGFGTYALWSDSTDLQGTVQSGHMTIALDGQPAWADASGDNGTTWTGTDSMVPGDVVTMTQAFDIDSEGKNLALNLTVDTIDTNTWDNLDVTMTLDGTALQGDVARGFAAPDAGDGPHQLIVTFDFDDATATLDDQEESVDLSDFSISIDQVRPTP